MYPLKRMLLAVVMYGAIGSANSIAADETQYSGYLGEGVYARLQPVEIDDGTKKGARAERWIGPKASFANYKSVWLKEVVLYPEPQTGPQVSAETLQEIQAYLEKKFSERIGSLVKLVDKPGPQVLAMEAAVTAVEIKTEGMKAYEVIPMAAVFAGAKAAAGKRAQDVRVCVEVKFTDSQTGELVAAVVRDIQGDKLKGKKDRLTLEDMQGNLDEAAASAQAPLEGALSPKQ